MKRHHAALAKRLITDVENGLALRVSHADLRAVHLRDAPLIERVAMHRSGCPRHRRPASGGATEWSRPARISSSSVRIVE
jgi:hypothetical protein